MSAGMGRAMRSGFAMAQVRKKRRRREFEELERMEYGKPEPKPEAPRPYGVCHVCGCEVEGKHCNQGHRMVRVAREGL